VIAVLLSTYNGDRYICDLLNSINRQRFKFFDLYIRDDGSNDLTTQLIESFNSPNLKRFIKGKNIGVVRSFLELLEIAGDNYDYYAFCDQDDVWLEDKLGNAVELLMRKNRDIPLLYFSRYELVSSNLNHIRYSSIPKKIGFGNAIVQNIAAGCTMVINLKAREAVLKKKPSKILMHDWWYYLVVSALGEIIYDERVSIKYRLHEENVVGAATSFCNEYKNKLKRFFSSNKTGTLALSYQTEEFYNLYVDELKEKDKKLLAKILTGKFSIRMRIGLVLSGRIWRQSLLDNLILRLLFLLNRY